MCPKGDSMTKEQLEDVKHYLLLNKQLSNCFGNYSRLYTVTTENIMGYLSKYDLKDKTVLTVGGSGDQRLNSYLLGAKEVTCFDINPLTELQLKLKDAAIKTFTLKEFMFFFGIDYNYLRDINEILDSKQFERLKEVLDEKTKNFFDCVINGLDMRPLDIYYNIEDYEVMKKVNKYFDKESYKKLQKLLKTKKVDFFESNISELPEKLDGKKFDFILLSNISDYIHKVYYDDSLRKYKRLIERLKQNLNDNGVIQVGYVYSRYDKGEDISDFHYKSERNPVFLPFEYKYDYVESIYNDGSYDTVISYKKTL